jgi:hypothetical protein
LVAGVDEEPGELKTLASLEEAMLDGTRAIREPGLPDLAGLTAREAVSRLAVAGIVPRLHGAGFVERQMPLPGTPLDEAGNQIELWLVPSTS